MERFRTSLRGVPIYKAWLQFADELNRFGVALSTLPPGT
jgi:hypothetical protein